MKKCPKCSVDVLNNRLTCPLCHTVLDIDGKSVVYQEYPRYIAPVEKSNLSKRIVLFLGIIIIMISIVINYLTFDKNNPSYWSSIVVAGIMLALSILLISILSNLSIFIKILAPAIFTELLFLVIEINLQKYWSIYYFVPFLTIGLLITIFILHLSLKNRGKELVVNLLFCDCIAIVVSIILLIRKIKVQWTYFTLLTFSLIMLLIIFFFLGKSLKEELAKKMHI